MLLHQPLRPHPPPTLVPCQLTSHRNPVNPVNTVSTSSLFRGHIWTRMESWSPAPTPHRPTEVKQLDDAAEVTCRRGDGQVLDVIACWTTPSFSLSCDPGDVLRGGSWGSPAHLCFYLLLCSCGREWWKRKQLRCLSSSPPLPPLS